MGMALRAKVLVVEDNPTTRTLLRDSLDLEGYDVSTLPDGAGVSSFLEHTLPDLVILDVMMPGLDGYTVLRQIRENDRTRGLPVLLLTALDDSESTWKGWTSGCSYYLTKPFDLDDLMTVVENLATGVAA